MSPARTSSASPLFRRLVIATIGLSGLTWGAFALPNSRTSDQLREMEDRLLRSENYDPVSLAQAFNEWTVQNLSACDSHAQRALLLIEMPLAPTALRSGDSLQFDQHVRSLEARARKVIGCSPRDGFSWLLLFDLATLHGDLSEKSFDLLALSYDTTPNEAWISVRRFATAVPFLLLTPEPARKAIFSEFDQLIRNGFAEDAARPFSTSASPVRAALQEHVEHLDTPLRDAFLRVLKEHRF